MTHTLWNDFVLTFVPLFVVLDAAGNLPMVISLTEGMTGKEKIKVIDVATVTAAVVGLAFLFFGQFLLHAMGISVGAFAVALAEGMPEDTAARFACAAGALATTRLGAQPSLPTRVEVAVLLQHL
ncbi:MAG: MarC family protein [Anaerolineaceae bacterium]